MALLNRIQAVDEPGPPESVTDPRPTTPEAGKRRSLSVTLDVGRNVVVAVTLVGLLLGIVVLYATGNDLPGRLLIDLFVAVLAGGLGINAGERAAVKEAGRELSQ